MRKFIVCKIDFYSTDISISTLTIRYINYMIKHRTRVFLRVRVRMPFLPYRNQKLCSNWQKSALRFFLDAVRVPAGKEGKYESLHQRGYCQIG